MKNAVKYLVTTLIFSIFTSGALAQNQQMLGACDSEGYSSELKTSKGETYFFKTSVSGFVYKFVPQGEDVPLFEIYKCPLSYQTKEECLEKHTYYENLVGKEKGKSYPMISRSVKYAHSSYDRYVEWLDGYLAYIKDQLALQENYHQFVTKLISKHVTLTQQHLENPNTDKTLNMHIFNSLKKPVLTLPLFKWEQNPETGKGYYPRLGPNTEPEEITQHFFKRSESGSFEIRRNVLESAIEDEVKQLQKKETFAQHLCEERLFYFTQFYDLSKEFKFISINNKANPNVELSFSTKLNNYGLLFGVQFPQ